MRSKVSKKQLPEKEFSNALLRVALLQAENSCAEFGFY